MPRGVHGRRALLAALAAAVLAAFAMVALPQGRAALSSAVAWLGAAGMLGRALAAGMVVVCIPLGVPTLWLAALVGYVFGPALGVPIAVVAVFAGANVAFALARWLLREQVAALVARRRRWRAIAAAVDDGGVRLVALLRLAGPHNVLNMVLAASPLSQRRFAAGTFIGSLPSVTLAALGGGLARDAASLWAARSELGAAWTVMAVAGAVALLFAVALLVRASRRALAAATLPYNDVVPAAPIIRHTDEMEWEASPSATVLRKRLELRRPGGGRTGDVGGSLPAGQLVSRARAPGRGGDPRARGRLHRQDRRPSGRVVPAQPGGIRARALVARRLRAVREAAAVRRARSRDGAHRHARAAWSPHPTVGGVEVIELYRDERHPETMRLVRIAAGAEVPLQQFPRGEEIFVVEGAFRDEHGAYRAGSWVRYPPGSSHTPRTRARLHPLRQEGPSGRLSAPSAPGRNSTRRGPACYTGACLPAGLSHIFEQKRIIVCVGSGGVGKTTTAAAVALEGARRGKQALVLTIDPARRLASSLGLKELGHDVQVIPEPVLRAAGEVTPGGRLSAMMLDQRRAFDEVVARHASDPEAVKRILANPIYGQIAGSLAGAQEYAALAKLEEFEREKEHQLIVVNTPPTSHALDFLDAPEKLTAAIDSPAIEWFRKLRGQEGGGWSMVGRTGAYVLKRLSKFVGTRFLDDLALFFTEFNDILGGFRQRAEATFSLLRRKDVGFVLVASPEQMAMREALSFHKRLVASGMPMTGFVVNRVHQSRPLHGSVDAAGLLAAYPPVQELGCRPARCASRPRRCSPPTSTSRCWPRPTAARSTPCAPPPAPTASSSRSRCSTRTSTTCRAWRRWAATCSADASAARATRTSRPGRAAGRPSTARR